MVDIDDESICERAQIGSNVSGNVSPIIYVLIKIETFPDGVPTG